MSIEQYELENIEEVEKLLKFTEEMQMITQYKSGNKPNVQKIRLWLKGLKGRC